MFFNFYSNSKSQRYLDGSSLVKIPSRTIEWRSFTLERNSEQYLYRYLELFAADALNKFLSQILPQMLDPESDPESVIQLPHYALIKSLFDLISRCITSPQTIILKKLDHLRRLLGVERRLFENVINDRQNMGNGQTVYEVPVMSAEDALYRVQQAGKGNNGGMNRYVTSLHKF